MIELFWWVMVLACTLLIIVIGVETYGMYSMRIWWRHFYAGFFIAAMYLYIAIMTSAQQFLTY